MNKIKHVKGKLVRHKLPKEHDTWEKQINYIQGYYILENVNHEDKTFTSDLHFYHDKNWYWIELKDVTAEEISIVEETEIGYRFDLKWYNGGTSFQEFLKDAIINKNNT